MDSSKRLQDRSQAKVETGAPSDSAVKIAPDASAALAEAIKTARGNAKPALPASAMTTPASRWSASSRFAAQAAIAILFIGAGWSASYLGTLANRDAMHRLEAEAARSQDVLARLSGDLDALKNTVAAFKEIEHTSSTASASERTKLADKVERLAVSLQEPGKTLTSLEGRLDKMESQIMTTLAALNTKPAAPAAPTAAVTEAAVREEAPAPKPAKSELARTEPAKSEPTKSEPAKSEPVDGWVLREVYNGAALVESRSRRLYEVMPGGILPGVGKVEAIERRGTRWVVLTDKGFIGTYR